MNTGNQIRVEIENGQACVTTPDGRFHVAQQGGTNAMASCPMCLMLGALGSCIMLTLNAVAQNKGISLNDTHVLLDYYRTQTGNTHFQVNLRLTDNLTDREQKILFRSAQLCEVGKILKSDISIDYHLLDQAPEAFCRSDAGNPGQ